MTTKPKNPHVKRAKKAKRQAEALIRNEAYAKLPEAEKCKRTSKKYRTFYV